MAATDSKPDNSITQNGKSRDLALWEKELGAAFASLTKGHLDFSHFLGQPLMRLV